MATKTNLITAINAQLTAIITQAKVRLASLEIVNELYPTVIDENTSTVSKVVTAENTINTDLTYNVSIAKQGRIVTIQGKITNLSGVIVDDSDTDNFFFEIVDAEYLKRSTGVNIRHVCSNGSTLLISNNKIYCNQIGAGETIDFEITYFTQN